MTRKRCAIYTRKSTDEGLDQSFNSLDAQREACEAFIISQKHEGWLVVKTAYDDGGYSGGSMERPALEKLLEDIRANLVDIVIVYKIDRLTRSLADFSKMVEVFDEKGVSFVSVTQQFNTTTSMGRLTLNVLLSFAQFEREVTAERIKDKIAASKRKGLWMGGSPPLGYDARDKKLVINREEAAVVRTLFEAYLQQGTINKLTAWASKSGVTTKIRHDANGKFRSGGLPFSRGNLHSILKNRTYIGEVTHKGANFVGEQEAIISPDLWNKVQAKLALAAATRRSGSGIKRPLPLTGIVFDETGDRLTPVHTTKQGRRYHYYVSTRLTQGSGSDQSGWRLPAKELERSLVRGILEFLKDEHQVLSAMPGASSSNAEPHCLNQILKNARQLHDNLDQAAAADRLQLILPAIFSISLGTKRLQISLMRNALKDLLAKDVALPSNPFDDGEDHYVIDVSLAIKRRGVETRLTIGGDANQNHNFDPHMVRVIARARSWFEALKTGAAASINDIAKAENIPASEISRQLPLAFLAPQIVEAILQGRQPAQLTVKGIQRLTELPRDWKQQAQILGF